MSSLILRPCFSTLSKPASGKCVWSWILGSGLQDKATALPITYPLRFVSRKRQVRIPPKPLPFDLSTDRGLLPDVDLSQATIAMQHSSELKKAPEVVQRMNSLKYANKVESSSKLMQETLSEFEHYPGDRRSLEVKIAQLTIQIRNQISTLEKNRHDTRGRNIMNHRLQRRKKFLKYLRREDYAAMQRVCKELQINYVPEPTSHWRVSRRARRKQEVVQAAIALRRQKLTALKELLSTQEQEYLTHKQQALEQLEQRLNSLEPRLLNQDSELKDLQQKLEHLQLKPK